MGRRGWEISLGIVCVLGLVGPWLPPLGLVAAFLSVGSAFPRSGREEMGKRKIEEQV